MAQLRVGLFPYCCGAKILYGFPSGYHPDTITAYGTDHTNKYVEHNNKLAQQLSDDIASFFDKGFTAYAMETSETYEYKVSFRDRRAEGSNPLDKNAFVLAITNDQQDHLCRPILEKFGFKCIEEKKNPNSGHIVYLYLLLPTW